MLRLAVILATAIACLPAFAAESAEQCQKEVPICGGRGGSLPFASERENVEAIDRCRDALQNCAKELLGSSARVIAEDSFHFALAIDAKLATKVADAAKANELQKLSMEYSEELTRLASSQALHDMKGWLDQSKDIYSDKVAGDDGMGGTVVASINQGRQLEMLESWNAIKQAVNSCNVVENTKPAPEKIERLREALVCVTRLNSPLHLHPVLKKWPGCPCGGFDTKTGKIPRGAMVGDTCVAKEDDEGPFTQYPIDKRVPDILANTIKKLNARIAPDKVKTVGLLGCTIPRPERGDTQHIDTEQDPKFHSGDISSHARATGCDFRFLEIQKADGGTYRFNLKEANKLTPYTAALAKFEAAGLVKKPYKYENGRKTNDISEPNEGIGSYYRKLESYAKSATPPKNSAGKPIMSDDEWKAFRLGVFSRNSLADSGVIVYDPVVNLYHKDHFHFEIPMDSTAWNYATRGDISDECHDYFLEPYLHRGAGLPPWKKGDRVYNHDHCK